MTFEIIERQRQMLSAANDERHPDASPQSNSLTSSDQVIYAASAITICAWISMLSIVYCCTESSDWRYLSDEEQRAARLAVFTHLVALTLQSLKVGMNRFQFANSSVSSAESSSKSNRLLWISLSPGSGVLVACGTVQFISVATNLLLGFLPTVVKLDPITRSPVFLIRWCEWIPLSGFMTFLSECIDVDFGSDVPKPNSEDTKSNHGDKRETIVEDAISLKTIAVWSLTQTLSCIPGIVLPFCNDLITWNLVMLFSMITHFCIFPRVWIRRQLYLEALEKQKINLRDPAKRPTQQMVSEINSPVTEGTTSSLLMVDHELVERRRFSFHLIETCAFVWTVLVVIYFANMMLHLYPIQWISTLLPPSSLAMVADTCFDVIAKVLYMRLIVDIYLNVFDPAGRIQKQLQELRHLVSAIWESSSDVIAISVKIKMNNITSQQERWGKSRIISLLSPSFTELLGVGDQLATLPYTAKKTKHSLSNLALMLEFEKSAISVSQNSEHVVVSAYYVHASSSSTMPTIPVPHETISALVDLDSHVVVEATRLVENSWNAMNDKDNDSIISDNSKRKEQNVDSGKDSNLSIKKWLLRYHPVINALGKEITCEMKVSRHAENSLVAVVRDVTERDRRFEAERKAHAETLARQRDAQVANRFTRHEVKNGLLAGIELCDSMRKSFESLKTSLVKELMDAADNSVVKRTTNHIEESAAAIEKQVLIDEGVVSRRLDDLFEETMSRHISELDRTLQEVLETTLTEAMSREVVHEVYVPRMERVNICLLLERDDLPKKERFPVQVVDKERMPDLLLDVQLLNYVHRNAVSNACKYGKPSGVVATKAWYENDTQSLTFEVSNEPGFGHDDLLDMGDTASDAVFQQGVRLQPHRGNNEDVRASSGDGAWIMQKCAMTLGGKCSIQFLPTETIFSFVCQAHPALIDSLPNYHDFRVPSNTWGIAVDDSRIQRKLMDRILANVGVEEPRRHLLGELPSEIDDLSNLIHKLLEDEGEAYILILMDENLDYRGEDSVPILISGSVALKELLKKLSPKEERRVLGLIRSANDSAEEISWYSGRSHGFFPKATMQKERVREILAPLWNQRFNTPNTKKSYD